MEVTKQHRVFNGRHLVYVNATDLSAIFYKKPDGREHIRLSLAAERCYTEMDLGEFCEWLYAVQKEIRDRHFGETHTMDDVLNQLYPPSTGPLP